MYRGEYTMEKIIGFMLGKMGIVGNHTIDRCKVDERNYKELETAVTKIIEKAEVKKDALNG